MSRRAFTLVMRGLQEALDVARGEPIGPRFRAHFTDGSTMDIKAEDAGDARATATEHARSKGIHLKKVKVIKEQPDA